MTGPNAPDGQRAKWHAYFAQTLGGSAGEIAAATDAAMAAIARREDQAGVVAAGRAAAQRYRAGGARPSPAPPPSPAPGPPAWDGASSSAAVVTSLVQRQEVFGRIPYQVWNFRLQQRGQQGAQLIPVEIRARSISGQLANGDLIEIPRKKNPMRLTNLTTGATIVARGKRHRVLNFILLTIFFIVFIAIAITILLTALNLSSQG